ncbi:MAG: alpha/beta fold hydrolase [Acidobacteriota bacterium]
MPAININGVELSYREYGNAAKPTIVFTHSLIWDGTMFEDLIAQLSQDFHIINIDQHGHGASSSYAGLTLEAMAKDYAAMLDNLGLEAVHWAGLSLGGMVGMRLALAYPNKVQSLILMDTSAQPEPAQQRELYIQLATALRAGQAASVVDAVLAFFFAPTTFANKKELVEHYRKKLIGYNSIEGIFQAALAVFNRNDISDRLSEISVPALIIVGEHDIATTVDRSELLAARIPNAQLVIIKEAGHMSATEQPGAVAAAITKFLTKPH